MSGAVALSNIGQGIVDLGVSYRKNLENKETHHKDRMSHLDRQLDFQQLYEQRQEFQGSLEHEERLEHRKMRQDAMNIAQEENSDIGAENLAALLEVFEDEEECRTYLGIHRSDVKRAWVMRKIAKMPDIH